MQLVKILFFVASSTRLWLIMIMGCRGLNLASEVVASAAQ